MPKKQTIERAKRDKREGKSSSTQAGEFVRETIEDIRKGKHGARSTKQAIAIGLSKARRAGVDLPPPRPGEASKRTRDSAKRDYDKGQSGERKVNPKRSQAVRKALKKEGHAAASSSALSRQAKQQAKRRTAKERSQIARKAAQTRAANQRNH